MLAKELGVPESPQPVQHHVGARDAAERLAVRAFEKALGRGPVGVREDFFALGGDPLVVLDELRPDLDSPVELFELRESPTAEALAEVIRGRQRRSGLLRPLRTSGARPPVFFAHPAGGDTAVFRQFVDLLADAQPCYGLERISEVTEVGDRAARYAELITATQPQGPYRLGGWPFGGVLAYETARLLTESGASVDLVFMLDSGLPCRWTCPPNWRLPGGCSGSGTT